MRKTVRRRVKKKQLYRRYWTAIICAVIFMPALADADGWRWVCEYWSSTPINQDCGTYLAGCPGSCTAIGAPAPGSSDCGVCVSTWNPLSYCYNGGPINVAFANLTAPCDQQTRLIGYDTIEGYCDCGAFTQNGTVLKSCTCM
jgi:hypothetical protein